MVVGKMYNMFYNNRIFMILKNINMYIISDDKITYLESVAILNMYITFPRIPPYNFYKYKFR